MALKTVAGPLEGLLRAFYDQAGTYIAGTHLALRATTALWFAGQTGYGPVTAPTNPSTGISTNTQIAHQPLGSFDLPALAAAGNTTVVVNNNLVRDVSQLDFRLLSDPGAGVTLVFVVTARTMASNAGQFTVKIYNNGGSASAAHTTIGYSIWN